MHTQSIREHIIRLQKIIIDDIEEAIKNVLNDIRHFTHKKNNNKKRSIDGH